MAANGAGAAEVRLEHIGVAFGATEVLKDVNLIVEAGEFFTFLGPSGSGKSTLLRLIAGFGPRPAGRVWIGENDVTDLPPWRRNVGMVFQSYALWPHMTVRKNVAFGLEERRVPADEIKRRVAAALDLVELGHLADRRPSQLSGGQQQRVALARTIVVEPRVLLLDEPLSNLDANLRVQMRRDILALQRKLSLTTIFVTHDQEEANTVSDRIAVLDGGVIQQVGSPVELYDRPVNRFVAHFLGTANLIEGTVAAADGTAVFRTADGLTLPLGAVAAVAAGGPLLQDGSPRTLLFRPQSLTIAAADAAPPSGAIRLEGTVAEREFLGSLVRYAVEVGRHRVMVDDGHRLGRKSFAVGDRVALTLDPAEIRLLPD